jgi:hypothetical protein
MRCRAPSLARAMPPDRCRTCNGWRGADQGDQCAPRGAPRRPVGAPAGMGGHGCQPGERGATRAPWARTGAASPTAIHRNFHTVPGGNGRDPFAFPGARTTQPLLGQQRRFLDVSKNRHLKLSWAESRFDRPSAKRRQSPLASSPRLHSPWSSDILRPWRSVSIAAAAEGQAWHLASCDTSSRHASQPARCASSWSAVLSPSVPCRNARTVVSFGHCISALTVASGATSATSASTFRTANTMLVARGRS